MNKEGSRSLNGRVIENVFLKPAGLEVRALTRACFGDAISCNGNLESTTATTNILIASSQALGLMVDTVGRGQRAELGAPEHRPSLDSQVDTVGTAGALGYRTGTGI